MFRSRSGYTVIEVLVCCVMASIFLTIIMSVFVNNRGSTEERALVAAKQFALDNNIEVKRVTCAGDSDADGYGSCSMLTESGEKIMLQCPSSFTDVKLFGAKGCKEVFFNLNMQQQ